MLDIMTYHLLCIQQFSDVVCEDGYVNQLHYNQSWAPVKQRTWEAALAHGHRRSCYRNHT